MFVLFSKNLFLAPIKMNYETNLHNLVMVAIPAFKVRSYRLFG